MCHLLLALPLVALPMFWLLPATAAVFVYSLVLMVSLGTYALAVAAMRRRVVTGAEALLHGMAKVLSVDGKTLTVRVHSELWSARAAGEPVRAGDQVEIVGIDGLTLQVRRVTGLGGGRSADAPKAARPG